MKMRSMTPMRVAKTGYILMSLIFCALGLLFILRPDQSLAVMGRVLGIAMIAFGAFKLVGYFSRDLYRLAFQYDLEFGILLVVLGIIVLPRSEDVMGVLAAALGIAILADGLFKARIATDSRAFGIRDWWVILVLAVITCGAGGLLVLRPWQGARLLARLLGVSLLCEGGLNLCVAVSTVKIIDHQHPDVIEVEYTGI
ncbi:MAG: DUF308 domain-containing protein [Oscillibacter sp.]|nr:DUF308 domain-containing protein [Oscillibacter sp.]